MLSFGKFEKKYTSRGNSHERAIMKYKKALLKFGAPYDYELSMINDALSKPSFNVEINISNVEEINKTLDNIQKAIESKGNSFVNTLKRKNIEVLDFNFNVAVSVILKANEVENKTKEEIREYFRRQGLVHTGRNENYVYYITLNASDIINKLKEILRKIHMSDPEFMTKRYAMRVFLTFNDRVSYVPPQDLWSREKFPTIRLNNGTKYEYNISFLSKKTNEKVDSDKTIITRLRSQFSEGKRGLYAELDAPNMSEEARERLNQLIETTPDIDVIVNSPLDQIF